MEYFAVLTGVQLTHVPFKGANETTMAMLANQIDASITGSSNILPYLPAGKLRALAITTAQRSPQAPDVPTMQEAGVPGYQTQSLYGLFAPARTPPDTINKIHTDLTEIIMRPDVKTLLAARSFEVQGKTAAEFQRIIDNDIAKWQKVITTAKIKED
jgi:tripartite-type tricarboxylate transporter receptor subunit TctC